MRSSRVILVLVASGAILAVGLAAVAWTLGAGSSEAQEGAMHNCPRASKWAISVWSGDDGTDAGQALATCGEGAVNVAYYIDPDTQEWLRWFAGQPELSNLDTLNDMQGVMALGAVGEEAVPFSLQLIPQSVKGDTIAGQRCVFLITVADEGEGGNKGEAVRISATAPGAEVTAVPNPISPGQVGEVTVIPDQASIGKTVTVTIQGERGGLNQTQTITFDVMEGEDTLEAYATEVRDRFIPWLAINYPELEITGDTQWTGTIVSPIWLVVSHYLFFSDEWEMHVSWHVMIAPHDWARIDLRHRFTEERPSHAFEISSLQAQEQPHPVDPEESVWR
jgi:hypothetical protein